jgi:hypothetical protein
LPDLDRFLGLTHRVTEHLGPMTHYTVASFIGFLTDAAIDVDALILQDERLDASVAESDGISELVLRVRAEPSWLTELEERIAIGEQFVSAGRMLSASLHVNVTNLEFATVFLRKRCELGSAMTDRPGRYQAQVAALMGRLEARLVDARNARDIAQRQAHKRVVETESGIAGLLAGVGTGLAVMQLTVSAWWAVAAALAVFGASVLWIVSDVHFRRMHAAPFAFALGSLVAAIVNIWSSWALVSWVAFVLSSLLFYWWGQRLLARIGHEVRSSSGKSRWATIRMYFRSPLAYPRSDGVSAEDKEPTDG